MPIVAALPAQGEIRHVVTLEDALGKVQVGDSCFAKLNLKPWMTQIQIRSYLYPNSLSGKEDAKERSLFTSQKGPSLTLQCKQIYGQAYQQ